MLPMYSVYEKFKESSDQAAIQMSLMMSAACPKTKVNKQRKTKKLPPALKY